MKKFILFSILFSSIALSSCDDEVTPNKVTVYSTKFSNLPADPGTGFDPITGAPLGTTGHFTFYRLSDSTQVELSDSAKGKWDLGFRGSQIIINGGTGRPGKAEAKVIDGVYENLLEIPSTITFGVDDGSNLAIGNQWGIYDKASMIYNPAPGKIILLKSHDGNYAKLEVISYYKNAPINPDARKDLPRYYTFRYVYQSNGTKKLQ